MSPCEHWDVHGHVDGVGLVEAHAEVPLPAQQQQDEHADVHESDAGWRRAVKQAQSAAGRRSDEAAQRTRLTLVGPGVVQVEEDGHQDIQHVAALQDKKQELLLPGRQMGDLLRGSVSPPMPVFVSQGF